MADTRYMEHHTPYLGESLTKAHRDGHRVPVAPLAQYMEDAANAFAGIECVLGLVAASDLRESYPEDGPCFSPGQRAHLLALAEVSAKLMRDEAQRISEWADERHPLKKEVQHA